MTAGQWSTILYDTANNLSLVCPLHRFLRICVVHCAPNAPHAFRQRGVQMLYDRVQAIPEHHMN